MKILLTGATGLIGKRLAKRLHQENHELVILTRNPKQAEESIGVPCRAYGWDALQEIPPLEAFQDVDAVIHLAGEPIGNSRWTLELKKRIYDSRVVGTHHLIQALQTLEQNRPKVLIAASAVGYYGDRGDEILTEEAPPGRDFLADVCQAWEKQSIQAATLSIRTVVLRIGMVLSEQGGALEKILPLFKMKLGATIGNGNQWGSWIHLDDLIEVISFALKTPSIEGTLNAVAPEPMTNLGFTQALAKATGTPSFLKVPALALKLSLGEMSTLLLSSQRVVPKKLLQNSFSFRYPTPDLALADICKKTL